MVTRRTSKEGASARLSLSELNELDRQWAAIKSGEPTVALDDVARWLDTWGTPRFRPWQDR